MLRSAYHTFLRAGALCLAIFTLLNFLGDFVSPAFNGNEWWIMFPRPLHAILNILTLPFTVALAAFAIAPQMSRLRQRLTLLLLITFSLVALWNTTVFLFLNSTGHIHSTIPIPLSSILAIFLILCASAANRPAPALNIRFPRLTFAFATCSCAAAFALLQMFCFGKTDYRRQADAIVVFGARAYADGRLSDALADRVRTACDLYHHGFAPKLIFSGGPGDGAIHETDAMKNFAIAAGVASADIILDQHGFNTQATVRNTAPIFHTHRLDRILCVSHFYHLPRIKLAYQRAGINVYTVPARESYLLGSLPIFMAREVAALTKYYFIPS